MSLSSSIRNLFRDRGPAGLLSGAAVLAVSSVASRVLGLVRDRLLAGKFGAGFELDAYNAAFRLPDLLFNLLVLGALSSAFLPVFADYLAKGKRAEAFTLARSLFTIAFLVLVVLCVGMFVFAEPLSYLVASDWVGDQRVLLVRLLRVMLLAPIFFGLSNILTGILNSFRRFVATSFAPVFYNIGIVGGFLLLVPRMGIEGVAWGVSAGAFLHFLVQVPSARRLGFTFKPAFAFFHEGLIRIVRLLLPRTLGMAVTQINLLVIAFLATRLAHGSLTQFTFANNLQSFPLGVFGFSFAVSAFPLLAETASRNDTRGFRAAFMHASTQILLWLLPASAFLILLREHVVRLVIGSGAFDWQDTLFTARTLGFLALSLAAQGLVPLVARAFFALQDTRTPVLVSILALFANIGLSFVLGPVMGIAGLGLAFTIGTILNFVVLFIWLRVRVGGLDDQQLFRNSFSILIGTLAALAVGAAVLVLTNTVFDTTRFIGLLLQALATLGAGAIVYAACLWVLKLEEFRLLLRVLRRRIGLS